MSDETITDEYLDRLQAICDAATAGPWDGVISTGCVRYLGRPMESRGLQHGDYIAAAHGGGDDDPGRDVNNAEFIAESRTALPLLVAEIRRLKGMLAWKEAQQVPQEVRDFAKKFGDGFSFLEE